MIWRGRRSGPGYSMTAPICVRSQQCTGSYEPPGECRERRRQRTHPAKKKPELIATKPNQVWSWGITKLKGPEASSTQSRNVSNRLTGSVDETG